MLAGDVEIDETEKQQQESIFEYRDCNVFSSTSYTHSTSAFWANYCLLFALKSKNLYFCFFSVIVLPIRSGLAGSFLSIFTYNFWLARSA